jgi:hypothetical protein
MAKMPVGTIIDFARLAKRLPQIPFPPGVKDVHLDYEALVNSNVSVTDDVHDFRMLTDTSDY